MELFKQSIYNSNNFNFGKTYQQLRDTQKKRLESLFMEKNIAKRFIKKETSDPRWYWVAAPLLDFLNPDYNDLLEYLLEDQQIKGEKKQHLIYLRDFLEKLISGDEVMGKFPAGFINILSDTLLSSPANASLYAFSSNTIIAETSMDLFKQAFLVADAFLSYFNKPESISAIRMQSKGKTYWRKTLNYCAAGNIASMLDEYFYMLKECDSKNNVRDITELMESLLSIRPSNVDVDLQSNYGTTQTKAMRCHFAVSYGVQKLNTESGNNRLTNVRTVFNSPFRPFVLTSTSIGQEGLDFHFYCRKIFHWNLPHNAIDLEQREGRINRYKGLVIRNKIAQTIPNEYLNNKGETSIWKLLFKLAEDKNQGSQYGINPFWYLDEGNTKIERFVPIHRFSKDQLKYERLKTILALYRLTFGQPRQEELIEALRSADLSEEELNKIRKNLLINLSPIQK